MEREREREREREMSVSSKYLGIVSLLGIGTFLHSIAPFLGSVPLKNAHGRCEDIEQATESRCSLLAPPLLQQARVDVLEQKEQANQELALLDVSRVRRWSVVDGSENEGEEHVDDTRLDGRVVVAHVEIVSDKDAAHRRHGFHANAMLLVRQVVCNLSHHQARKKVPLAKIQVMP